MKLRLALLSVALLAVGGPANAGPPGTWTRVTDTNGRNTDHAALARTSDGVLHVAWHRNEANNRYGLVHTPVSASGVVGQPTTMATGWRNVGNHDLVRGADGGLQAFVTGAYPGWSPFEGAVGTISAPASGTTWSFRPAVSRSNHAGNVGAALTRDGTPVYAWDGLRTSAAYHWGADPSGAEIAYVEGLTTQTCGCPNFPDIGVDSVTGEVVLAWNSLLTNLPGLHAQTITPSGAGPVRSAPGAGPFDQQRVGITGRLGAGGVYIGYRVGSPTSGVALWRVGAAAPLFTIPARGARFAHVAAAPGGRLWLMWARDDRLFFTRTDKDATEHSDVVSIAPPQGTTSIWRLLGEGSRGPLDVLAHVSTPGSTATWHTQVLPPLEMTTRVERASGGGGGAKSGLTVGVTVKVTDAGDPVRGVKVTLGGATKTTNAQGVARFKVRRGRTYTATATQRGYRKDTAKVKAPKQRR